MQKTFQLTDDSGKTHDYRITPHPAHEGCHISYALTSEAIGPMTAAIGNLIMSGGDIEVEAVAPHLATLIRALDPSKQKDLLKYTVRDGELLSERAVFNAAFTDNYGEWMEALIRVVVENNFVPLGYFSKRLSKLMTDEAAMEKLTEKMIQLLPAEMRATIAEKAEAES